MDLTGTKGVIPLNPQLRHEKSMSKPQRVSKTFRSNRLPRVTNTSTIQNSEQALTRPRKRSHLPNILRLKTAKNGRDVVGNVEEDVVDDGDGLRKSPKRHQEIQISQRKNLRAQVSRVRTMSQPRATTKDSEPASM